jgi:hypothetical protein
MSGRMLKVHLLGSKQVLTVNEMVRKIEVLKDGHFGWDYFQQGQDFV